MVRYGKRLQHQILLDNGPFTSESVPAFRVWSCPSPLAPWQKESLVLGVIYNIFSSAHALAAWPVILFCCFWKATWYLVRNKIGTVWVGSAVTWPETIRLVFDWLIVLECIKDQISKYFLSPGNSVKLASSPCIGEPGVGNYVQKFISFQPIQSNQKKKLSNIRLVQK